MISNHSSHQEATLRFILDTAHRWATIETEIHRVAPEFFQKLLKKCPTLTQQEKKICGMLRLKLSTKEMHLLLGQQIGSINNARSRIRRKLQLNEEENLANVLELL